MPWGVAAVTLVESLYAGTPGLRDWLIAVPCIMVGVVLNIVLARVRSATR